jgi:hypothetical protein
MREMALGIRRSLAGMARNDVPSMRILQRSSVSSRDIRMSLRRVSFAKCETSRIRA